MTDSAATIEPIRVGSERYRLIMKPPSIETPLPAQPTHEARLLALCNRVLLIVYFCNNEVSTSKLERLEDLPAMLAAETVSTKGGVMEGVEPALSCAYEKAVNVLRLVVSGGVSDLDRVEAHADALIRVMHITLYSVVSAPLTAAVVDIFRASQDRVNAEAYLPRVSHVVVGETPSGDVSRCLILSAKNGLSALKGASSILGLAEEGHRVMGLYPIRYSHLVSSLKIKLRVFLDEAAQEIGRKALISEVSSMGLIQVGCTFGLEGG